MPSFKPKSNKKIKFNKKTSITLDTKHKEFLNEFTKDENNTIPDFKIERQELRQKLIDNSHVLTVEQKLERQNLRKKNIFLIILNLYLNILKIKKVYLMETLFKLQQINQS